MATLSLALQRASSIRIHLLTIRARRPAFCITSGETRALSISTTSRIDRRTRVITGPSHDGLDTDTSRSNKRIASNRAENHTNINKNSLFFLKKQVIKQIQGAGEVTQLVREIVRQKHLLSANHVDELILPLMDQIALVAGHQPKEAAECTEQLLFACLSRIVSLDYPTRLARAAILPIPTSDVYNKVIIAWGQTKTLEGAEEATNIFDLMVSEFNGEIKWLLENDPNNTVITSPAPCRRCYKSLIRAWAVVADAPGGPEQADKYLTAFEDECGITEILNGVPIVEATSGKMLEFPDVRVYNTVLSAYTKSSSFKNPQALERIKAIAAKLDRLQKITKDSSYYFDAITYQAILRAYRNYVSSAPGPIDPLWVDEIEAILQRIYKQDSMKIEGSIAEKLTLPWLRGVAIEALVKTEPLRETIRRADAMIFDMVRRYDAALSTHSSCDDYPRTDTVMLVAQGWSQAGLPDANDRIQRLIEVMKAVPVKRIYFLNQEMEMLVSSGWDLAPEVVEGMLERSLMPKKYTSLKPTGQTFAIAMKGWLRSERSDAPYRAELLFEKMLFLYQKKGDHWYRPRESHIRLLMTAWFNRAPQGRRLEGTLGTLYPAEHNEELLLTYQNAEWFDNPQGLFALAIRTWVHQKVGEGRDEPDPLEKAFALARHLKEVFGKLSAYPTNWVLEACSVLQSSPGRRKRAYNIAIDTFSRGERNARTFVLLVRAIKTQVGGELGEELNDEHVKVAEELFSECCSMGMLSRDMVEELITVLPVNSLQRLFRMPYMDASLLVQARENDKARTDSMPVRKACIPSVLDVQNLPAEWSQHADTGRKLKAEDDKIC